MARVTKTCECGYTYFTTDAQAATSACPSCGRCGTPRPVPQVIPAIPASAPRALDRKKLFLAVGGATCAVLAIVVLAVVLRGGGNRYEEEVELESRRALAADAAAAPRKSPAGTAPAAAPKSPALAPLEKPVPVAVPAPAPAPAPLPPAKAPQPAAAPAAKPPVAAAVPRAQALSPEMLGKLKVEVLALPPFYRGAVLEGYSEERLVQLASGAPATSDESTQVHNLLSGPRLKAVHDDRAKILERFAQAESVAGEGLPVDRVKMTDGRLISCKVVEEGPDLVKVERRLAGGVGGTMNLRREEVSQIEKGKGVGSEWPARWDSIRKGSMQEKQAGFEWCKANTLSGQARLVALLILMEDPSQAKAREEAGLPADPVRYAEEMARGGIILYQGRNWGAQELMQKLLKDGYEILNGKWVGKKERNFSVPGLYRYEKQEKHAVVFSSTSAPLTNDEQSTVRMVLTPSGSYEEIADLKMVRKFYAPLVEVSLSATKGYRNVRMIPDTVDMRYEQRIDHGNPKPGTALEGEVVITVDLGEPLLEASVMTLAEVRGGASITLFVQDGPGQRTRAYACAAKENQLRPLPITVKGGTVLELVAVIKSSATYAERTDRLRVRGPKRDGNRVLESGLEIVHHRLIPEYPAVLFPSNQNTLEVFRLKAFVAEPMPALDKLFEGCPELLR